MNVVEKHPHTALTPYENMDFKHDISCLQGKIVILPGGCDKEGRPIVLVTIPNDTSCLDIVTPLQYVKSLFSSATQSNGLTIIVDARKGHWKVIRSVIRQVSAVYLVNELMQLLIVKPDTFWDKQRIENCTFFSNEDQIVFIPRSRLNKFVDQSQLPLELGGNFIYQHDKWMETRRKVEEFFNDGEFTLKELDELHQTLLKSEHLRPAQLKEAVNVCSNMAESTKMLVHNTTETGRELVQNIEYDNRTRKLSQPDSSLAITSPETLDTIEKIHEKVNSVRSKQQHIDETWRTIERNLLDTKDLTDLEEGVVKVINWILGPAENLLNSRQKVGYDVASAEDLRLDHEALELQCSNAYGTYAELIHRINKFSTEQLTDQKQDLIFQKDFMDFVCRSFALRLERRRNILTTSLRFFRLVSEYFDRTGYVFDLMIMGSTINDLQSAAQKLKDLQDSQANLDLVEHELFKEGEKLSDMLSMPVKDALGRELVVDYTEDIINIHDILDATTARKNIFSDSVELQKLTLEQITHINNYEKDAFQAVEWLDDLLQVMLENHGHVGSNVFELQSQKEEHQSFQETAKGTYNYGCQLLNASLVLRQSCKLSLEDHNFFYQKLKKSWQRLLNVTQEQMTRLRVSVIFHRTIEEHCNKLRDLREAVATIPLMDLTKKHIKVNYYYSVREKLMLEVGRMVRLGRLLRTRLKEPLYFHNTSAESSLSSSSSLDEAEFYDTTADNEIAIEAITERLTEVTELAEELDQALKSAQQDCSVLIRTTSIGTSTIDSITDINHNTTKPIMDGKSSHLEAQFRPEDLKSDDEFLTASECTLQHSRSSSYNTASECEARYSPWWEFDKHDQNENLHKEKMILAVGLPELPPANSVLMPSPELPPGKIAHEVTETTHIKVQHSHTLGVQSFVLTSETIREKNNEATTTRKETVRSLNQQEKELLVPAELDESDDLQDDNNLEQRLKECGDWIHLKILEVTPELTLLGSTLPEALELKNAHDEVLRQLQNKKSPVEELLRQADQLIATQKPRAEVYASMAESLAKAWNDINGVLELRRQILKLNVQYHTAAEEFFSRLDTLEAYCADRDVPIEVDAVKKFLTTIHDQRRFLLESLMTALQAGNALLAKLKELGAEGTLDSRPNHIRTPLLQAISKVQGWMDELHLRRQDLEIIFNKRKSQLEQCLALALLASDLKELEDIVYEKRQLLSNSNELGDSASSAELLLIELQKLLPEAQQIQEKTVKITKATEQLVASGCFAGQQATQQAYIVLSATSEYLTDIENRDSLLQRTVLFFKNSQSVLNKLNLLESQLTSNELSKTSPQLAQLHAQCTEAIEEATSVPISEGYAILNAVGQAQNGTRGVKNMIEELENRKISLNSLCTAHHEESIRINVALNNFLEVHNEIYTWLVTIAETFLQKNQDMGNNLKSSTEYLHLHEELLIDLQKKGEEINALIPTLLPILEDLEEAQQKDVDSKVEQLHNQWMQLKQTLEFLLDMAKIYCKFHTEVETITKEMDNLDLILQNNRHNMTDEIERSVEDKFNLVKLNYQCAKNTGLTFVNDVKKASQKHAATDQACICVESVLEQLLGQQLIVSRNWQTFQTEVQEQRQLLILREEVMAESTKTINWVTDLESQLYPIITTSSTSPNDVAVYLLEKLESTLAHIQRAQNEVNEKIQKADSFINKSTSTDDSTLNLKNKLIALKQKVSDMALEYQILVQVIVGYFRNIEEIDQKCDFVNSQINRNRLPSNVQELQALIADRENSRQSILERLKFAESECEQISHRITKQEPANSAEHDIKKLRQALQLCQSNSDNQWLEQQNLLSGHRQFLNFNNDLRGINNTLDELSEKLHKLKGQYGDSLQEAIATSRHFDHFVAVLQPIENQIELFIKTGENLLAEEHAQSQQIKNNISHLQSRWEQIRNQVQETKRLNALSIQYFQLIEKAEQWFKEGSILLDSITKRSVQVTRVEQAQDLLNEIATFLKPGEIEQNERIKQITELAVELFNLDQSKHSSVLHENNEMLASFNMIQDQLSLLNENLIKEQERQANELRMIEENRKREASILEEKQRQALIDLQDAQRANELRIIEENRKREASILEEKQRQALIDLQDAQRAKASDSEIKPIEIIHDKIEPSHEKTNKIEQEIQIKQEKVTISEVTQIIEQQTPPIFTTPLSDAVLEEGSKLTLICSVTGNPLPEITWLKGGVSIQANPDYKTSYSNGLCTLSIEETFAEDSERYTCKATNPVGSAETTAWLCVQETEPTKQLIAPSFTKLLEPVTLRENSQLYLECKVEGNPLPTVQWFKNQECIDNSFDYTISYNNGDAVLKLDKVSLTDRGEYMCKASNQLGSAQSSASILVTPLEPTEPPTFIVPLSENLMARAGQKIKLECEVTGLPLPILNWSHNGKPVKETGEVKLMFVGNKSTLIIIEAFPKDAGTYLVTAKNIAGEASSSCSVSVKGLLPTETSDSEMASDMEPVKPSIGLPLTNVTTNEGSRVRLDCVIVGQPEPEVIWYHNDKPVKESPDFQLLFQGDRCSLVIQDAQIDDGGEYKVVAINSAGEASSKCVLKITPNDTSKDNVLSEESIPTTGTPPKFSKLLADVLVSEGDRVIFEGTVHGEPKPTASWLLNNFPITDLEHFKMSSTEEGDISLEISNVRPEDKGVYTVKATNPFGEAKCFAQLIVKSLKPQDTVSYQEPKLAPTFKQIFNDRVAFEDTATKFECIVVGKPTPKIKWLFNNEPIFGKEFLISTSGDRQVLVIPELKTHHSGEITCLAENELGKATCVAVLSVQSVSGITLPEANTVTSDETDRSLLNHKDIKSLSSQFTSSESKAIHKIEHTVIEKTIPVIIEKIDVVRTGLIKSDSETIHKQAVKMRSPKFVTPLNGKIVDQNVDVLLEGILDGQPSPSVTWTKNGEELRSDDRTIVSWKLNRATVEIKNVNVGDAGRYTCTAVNDAGTAVSTADLVVRKTIFPPVFGRRLQAQIIKKDDRICMEVEVTGTPEPTITWFKDGKPIESCFNNNYRLKSQGQSYSMIIDKAETSHTGRYMVRATNSGGTAESIADIAIFEPTPDTMVEVVKTVVFEDVRKQETLTSEANNVTSAKPLPEITSVPVSKIDIPVFMPSFAPNQISQVSSSSKVEFVEKTNSQSQYQDFSQSESKNTFEISRGNLDNIQTEESEISTQSISAESSRNFFIQKIKESDLKLTEPVITQSKLFDTKSKQIDIQRQIDELPSLPPLIKEFGHIEAPQDQVASFAMNSESKDIQTIEHTKQSQSTSSTLQMEHHHQVSLPSLEEPWLPSIKRPDEFIRPSLQSAALEPSPNALKMEKAWAHKFTESTLEKAWPPTDTTKSGEISSDQITSQTKKEVKVEPGIDIVTHYKADVSHFTIATEPPPTPIFNQYQVKTSSQLIDNKSVMKSEEIRQSTNLPTIRTLPKIDDMNIRPISVQDITDEVYLEPEPPAVMGYIAPPSSIPQEMSLVKTSKIEVEKRVFTEKPKEVSIQIKKQEEQLESSKSKEIVFYPELTPFPFTPQTEKPKTQRQGPPPVPTKFIKGKFTDSDYESDFEAIKIPPKWKPASSDTDEPSYKKVSAPKVVSSSRPLSTGCEPLPPSKFERPSDITGQSRPELDFESIQCKKELKKVTHHVTKAQESFREPSPPKLKPGSPPIIMHAERKPDSPKMKQKIIIDGYMADTDEPFLQSKITKMEFKQEDNNEFKHVIQNSETISQQKTRFSKSLSKKHNASAISTYKKEFVKTPIITTATDQERHIALEPVSIKPSLPPSTEFVKKTFTESDYESSNENTISRSWQSSMQQEGVKPVEKPVIFKPKPMQAGYINDIIIATPAIREPLLPEPGSPPEIAYAEGPRRTQYYRSTTSVPYHNAIQTETSNAMHFNESTQDCHRTVSFQQSTKVIKFDDQRQSTQQAPSPVIISPVQFRRSSLQPPPTPSKFIPGEFRESDYESEVESTRIKARWTPEGKYEDLHYRRVQAPHARSSSVPAQTEYLSRDYKTHSLDRKYISTHDSSNRQYKTYTKPSFENTSKLVKPIPTEIQLQPGSPPEYVYAGDQKITKAAATKIASHYMDSMTNDFKSKTQKFVKDIIQDVNQKTTRKPILKTTSDNNANVYREESRAAQYGTKHVDPDTGLIYFKYDFGYEFGIILPGQSKNGQITMPKKTITGQSTRTSDIEMPVYHESTGTRKDAGNKIPTPQFKPHKFTNAKANKWEPTSESEMSEYEKDTKNPNYLQSPRWEPSSCSPVSLSPSLPSTSPAFNNVASGYAGKGTETPPSCPSTPGSTHIKSLSKSAKPPLFITPLRDIAVLCGQAAKFECIIQSDPPPNIIWSKNGRMLENSNEYQIHHRNGVCRLTISQAYPEDAGTYSCAASTAMGTAHTSAKLQVPGERRSFYI